MGLKRDLLEENFSQEKVGSFENLCKSRNKEGMKQRAEED